MNPPTRADEVSTQAPLLVFRHVSKLFGGVAALSDLSFEVQRGELLGVIGPNGAGKSTLLSLIAGSQRPSSGEVFFDGQSLERIPPYAIARRGIGRARQIPRPFKRMTVRQNVMVCIHPHQHNARELEHHIQEILAACNLEEKTHHPVATLTLLDLKRLEVACALAHRPRLLLLDEVAAGLVGQEIVDIIRLIASLRTDERTIILVEHVQTVIQKLAERVMVLDWGRKIAEGTPKQIAADPTVIAVYFGKAESVPSLSLQTTAPSEPARTATLLHLEKVNVDYGKFRAIRAVDIEIQVGSTVAILGANGAGKTTLTRAISGLIPISGGRVLFNKTDITKYPAYRRARLGIALCHEGRRLFKQLTVRENIELGMAYASHTSTSQGERFTRVFELFPILKDKATTLAGNLSGGQQQMVAIARALVSEPDLLLLDELSLGLAPMAIDQIFAALPQICQWGTSIVLIEQHIHRSLAIADHVYLLERGQVSFSGSAAELQQQKALHQAYFGEETDYSEMLG